MRAPRITDVSEALIPLAGRPVARVAVDLSLAHLDRPFDYLIPDAMAETARPGVRVRVRFAGQLRDGFILELGEDHDPARRLAPLERVVSPEAVLTPEIAGLVREVADHYAGSFADVMRLAVPPRHAATEKAPPIQRPLLETAVPPRSPISHYPTGVEYLAALARGDTPRGFWQVAPTAAAPGNWADGLAAAAAAVCESGRGALLIVPDARDLARLREACAAVPGETGFVVLTAEDGPAARYRAFLAALRGDVGLVLGTRAAAYAPVRNLGLVAVWDDADDLHAEPRAPYPHTREILALRAAREQCAVLFAARHRSCEVQQLLDRGWLRALAFTPAEQRRVAPAVRLTADSDWDLERDPLARSVRMPSEVFTVVRAGLAAGPVLVQVPRAGYLVVLVCDTCRESVHCPHCHGPVRAGAARASCDWCARPVTGWCCPTCDGTRWRAPVVGAERTAEELGHAFPGARVVQSQGGRVLDTVGPESALVIATPGAEPIAETGYAAAVLLDTSLLLTRADLRAAEEAHRRWLNAVGLVRPGADGGTVVAVGPTESVALQALVRGDPAGFAARELADRAEAHLTPAAKMITIEGPVPALSELARHLAVAELCNLEELGPVEVPRSAASDDPIGRLTLRTPLGEGTTLVRAVKTVLATRSAKKLPGPLRVKVDPTVVG